MFIKYINILLFISFSATAQQTNDYTQPTILSLGFVGATITDNMASLVGNPSVIEPEVTSLLLSSARVFNGTDILAFSAGCISSLTDFNIPIGIRISNFGNKLYNENKISIQGGHKLGNTKIGLRMSWNSLQITEYYSVGFLTADIGVLTSLSPNINLGMVIYSLNNPSITESEFNTDPIKLESGISYFTENLEGHVSTLLQNGESVQVRIGLEYKVIEKLSLRTGISNKPFKTHYGINFLINGFDFYYSLMNSRMIGLRHIWGFGYIF